MVLEEQTRTNRSLIKPFLDQRIIEPLSNLLPRSLHPQWLSFVASILLYISGYLVVSKVTGSMQGIFIGLLWLGYTIFNSMMEAQIKRTEVSESLTYFIHFCFKSISTGMLLFVFIMQFEIMEMWLISGCVLVTYLAQAMVFYERFKTGKAIIEKFGEFEVLIIGALLIAASSSRSIQNSLSTELFLGVNTADYLLIIFSFSCLITTIKAIARNPHVTYGIWLFVLISIINAVFSVLMFSVTQTIVVIAAYGAWYVVKLVVAGLVDGVERSTGLFTPLILILGYFMHDLYPTNTFIIVTAYIGLNLALLIYRASKALINKERAN